MKKEEVFYITKSYIKVMKKILKCYSKVKPLGIRSYFKCFKKISSKNKYDIKSSKNYGRTKF